MNIRNTLTYSILTTLGLIGFFVAMKLFGLEHVHELRLLNFFIILVGVAVLHRKMFKLDGNYGYLGGLMSGIEMSALSIIFIMVFMSIYASVIDPTFIEVMEESSIWGGNLTLFQTGIAILFEGLASCIIISYTSMQYFKSYAQDKADWSSEVSG